jgi:(p)ppGpp synthase/HD superfamily hydrolase
MSHTDMIFRAVEFAARARTAQLSQSADVPDIVHPFGVAIIHPFGVAKILIDHTCPDELVAADILHDALDDTGATVEDIRRVFGDRMAQLVDAVSEPDKNREKHTLEYLITAPMDILVISCADKLDNVRAIANDYAKLSEALWTSFNRPEGSQPWYLGSTDDRVINRAEGEPSTVLFNEFKHVVSSIFQN